MAPFRQHPLPAYRTPSPSSSTANPSIIPHQQAASLLRRRLSAFASQGNTLNMKPDRHPQTLVSLSIIRTHPETDPRSAISSLALFSVHRRSRLDVAFALEHHFFDPEDDAADILAGAARSIPADATVLIRQARQAPANIAGPTTDAVFLARALDTNTVIAFDADEHELAEAGMLIGLDMPGPGSTPLRWRRRAPLHAQAMWVIYAASFCTAKEQRVLFSAHLAWCALQRARICV